MYAFLPREAVTKFLMSCEDCQKRMHFFTAAEVPSYGENDIYGNYVAQGALMRNMSSEQKEENMEKVDNEKVMPNMEEPDLMYERKFEKKEEFCTWKIIEKPCGNIFFPTNDTVDTGRIISPMQMPDEVNHENYLKNERCVSLSESECSMNGMKNDQMFDQDLEERFNSKDLEIRTSNTHNYKPPEQRNNYNKNQKNCNRSLLKTEDNIQIEDRYALLKKNIKSDFALKLYEKSSNFYRTNQTNGNDMNNSSEHKLENNKNGGKIHLKNCNQQCTVKKVHFESSAINEDSKYSVIATTNTSNETTINHSLSRNSNNDLTFNLRKNNSNITNNKDQLLVGSMLFINEAPPVTLRWKDDFELKSKNVKKETCHEEKAAQTRGNSEGTGWRMIANENEMTASETTCVRANGMSTRGIVNNTDTAREWQSNANKLQNFRKTNLNMYNSASPFPHTDTKSDFFSRNGKCQHEQNNSFLDENMSPSKQKVDDNDESKDEEQKIELMFGTKNEILDKNSKEAIESPAYKKVIEGARIGENQVNNENNDPTKNSLCVSGNKTEKKDYKDEYIGESWEKINEKTVNIIGNFKERSNVQEETDQKFFHGNLINSAGNSDRETPWSNEDEYLALKVCCDNKNNINHTFDSRTGAKNSVSFSGSRESDQNEWINKKTNGLSDFEFKRLHSKSTEYNGLRSLEGSGHTAIKDFSNTNIAKKRHKDELFPDNILNNFLVASNSNTTFEKNTMESFTYINKNEFTNCKTSMDRTDRKRSYDSNGIAGN